MVPLHNEYSSDISSLFVKKIDQDAILSSQHLQASFTNSDTIASLNQTVDDNDSTTHRDMIRTPQLLTLDQPPLISSLPDQRYNLITMFYFFIASPCIN